MSLILIPERQKEVVPDVMAYCDLTDFRFLGALYTYDNKPSGRADVKVRLDRLIANLQWRNFFAYIRVKHIAYLYSDHCSLHVCIGQEDQIVKKNPRCHYKIMWERPPTYHTRSSVDG